MFIEEFVESVDMDSAFIVFVVDYLGDAVGEPGGQFSDLHVVVEVDIADVSDTLERQLTVLGISNHRRKGLHHVLGDVLPNLHVYFLNV